MTPGDLVLVAYPKTDLHRGKLRPALVIGRFPGYYPDLLAMMITSKIHQAVPEFDEIVAADDPDYALAGLKSSSVIRLTRLATLQPSVIQARLGRVSPSRLVAIRKRLAQWLLSLPCRL